MAGKVAIRGGVSQEPIQAEDRAFAKSVEVLAADLKPKTQNLRPINQSFASLIKQGVEGFVYRF
jgi:hypothetical protein